MRFNPHSTRASRVRARAVLNNRFARVALRGGVTLGLIFGAGLWVLDHQLGYYALALATILVVIGKWRDGDLLDLSPKSLESDQIDQIVSIKLLPKLKGDVTQTSQLWKSLSSSWTMNFFANNFHIYPQMLDIPVKGMSEDQGEAIWQQARQLAREQQLSSVNGGAVLLAIIDQVPEMPQMLAQLSLTRDDILSGVRWQHHIQQSVEAKEEQTGANFGREWSVGYTPLLDRFSVNLAQNASTQLWRRETPEHRQLIEQITQQLAQNPSSRIGLIGLAGSGKTGLVAALASRLQRSDAPEVIRNWRVFSVNAITLLGQLENTQQGERVLNQLFAEVYRAGGSLLVFDDAEGLLSTQTDGVSLAPAFRTLLENAAVPVLMTFEQQAWQQLKVNEPNLTASINELQLPALPDQSTLVVLEDEVPRLQHQYKVNVTYQALKKTVSLSNHYMTELAQPGRALKLIESAVNHAEQGVVDEGAVARSVEAARGVKVQRTDASEAEQLLNLEDDIHRRLVNQSRAVTAVAQALRRARSGVSSKSRSMGTFLFLGPTGVGKTELARALGAIMFSGEEAMIRIDMNEYSQPGSVERLLDSSPTNQSSLLVKVKRQPYSVVLFDEVEKADSSVQDALLQLLDEGVMRDSHNNEVSFRDAIIIATSNAGADQIRRAVSDGLEMEQFEHEFMDHLVDSGQFKPEFLNRFDEAVVFRPLTQEELVQVVDIMMRSVNQQLGEQQIGVSLSDDAKLWLVQQGYDPRLGARPLRRVIQKTVESFVADAILRGDIQPGQSIQLDRAHLESA